MDIQTIGVIGAGTMGNGIAQACALKGLNVAMVDIDSAAVERGLGQVAASLERLVKKDKLSAADQAAVMSRIQTSTDYRSLLPAQLVIEAATENEGLKRKILAQLVRGHRRSHCPARARRVQTQSGGAGRIDAKRIGTAPDRRCLDHAIPDNPVVERHWSASC